MTIRALAGLAALATWYTLIGCLVLWAFGAIDTRRRIARYAGLGFVIGFALTGVLLTVLLLAGVPFTGGAVVWLLLAEAVAVAVIGRRVGRALPGHSDGRRWLNYPTALGIALAGLFFEALFAGARLQGLQADGAWSHWVPKAKAVFFFDGLDRHFFATLPGPTNPPLMPIMNASAFHALGDVDVVTLHVQYWLIAVALVWAVAGLLYERVEPWILWPLLLLLLVAPRVGGRLVSPQADIPLDAFLVVAVALLVLWIDDGRGWRLWSAALLLAAAVGTKREGLLLGLCVVLATLVATADRPRRALSAGAVLLGGMAVTFAPWRLWLAAAEVPSDVPASDDRDGRAWPALRLARDVLFDIDLWSLLPLLAVAAIGVALFAGRSREALFGAVLLATAWAGGAGIVWLYAELPLSPEEGSNPIIPYTLAPIMFGVVVTAWLLAAVWRGPADEGAAKEPT